MKKERRKKKNPKFIIDQLRLIINSLGILYFPQEYIPFYLKTTKTMFIDYLLGQLLSIESSNNLTLNYSSYVSFSLQQTYLNISNILQNYFSKIVLNRMKKNYYSHQFSFQLNTTKLARNVSLIFIDLPNSQKYSFIFYIAYNHSCIKTNRKTSKYMINIDLWQSNYFVYSIPIKSMSLVCAQVEIISRDVSIRNLRRIGYFLVIETGCYSFDTNIYDDYYSKVY